MKGIWQKLDFIKQAVATKNNHTSSEQEERHKKEVLPFSFAGERLESPSPKQTESR